MHLNFWVIVMKQFDHYCKTLRCKMSKETCIGRQLLAVKRQEHRLDTDSVLVCQGFYPECHSCIRGRRLARRCGINIGVLRGQLVDLRAQIEESPRIRYCIRQRFR